MNLKRKFISLIFSSLILFGLNQSFAIESINVEDLNRENLKTVSADMNLSTISTDEFQRIKYLKVNVDTVTDENNYSNIVSKRIDDTRGDFYQYDIKKGSQEDNAEGRIVEGYNIWQIRSYSDSNYKTMRDDKIYCIQADIGFATSENDYMTDASKNRKAYTTSYNFKDNKDTITSTFKELNISVESQLYNKVMWILDNAYIKTSASDYKNSEAYINLMRKAGIVIEDQKWDLSEDDIEIIQQMAIWYFTNSDKAKSDLPSLYINGIQLSSIDYGSDQYGTPNTGIKRQQKANKLYKYFITEANKNSSYTGTQEAELGLSIQNPLIEKSGDYYIVGPYNLSGKNLESVISIKGDLNNNISYKLLDSSKNEIADNNLAEVIGEKFYLKIYKGNLTQQVNNLKFSINYKYNFRKLTFWTDAADYKNTQPVVIIENIENNENTGATINMINITVKKVWEDNNNQDGKRPENIKIGLYRSGEKIEEITLSDNLEYTWYGLVAGEYEVREENVPAEYVAAYRKNDTVTTITNTYIPKTKVITVRKNWDDANNQDGKRPDSITIRLFADGEETLSKILTKDNNWAYSFDKLPVYKDGKEITYAIMEDSVEGYTTTIEESAEGYNITNKYNPSMITVSGYKTWNDNDDQDGKRPTSITVKLLANGKEVANKIVTKDDNWLYSFNELPAYENGRKIEYTISEDKVEDYTTTIDGYNIINTYTPQTVNKTVNKVWEDNNNKSKMRPESITVKLFQKVGSEETDTRKVAVLNDINNWSYTFENLPKYTNKTEIIYIAKEIDVNGDIIENNEKYNNFYTTTYSEDTFTITNTYKSLDLSLRKFISNIQSGGSKSEVLGREPVVECAPIATKGTAEYKHSKNPIAVEVGDIVTYKIRLYNEGELNGYASEVTDYLPEYLDFLPEDEVNQKYLWSYDDDSRIVSTTITSFDSATGEDIYSSRKNENREKGQLLLKYNEEINELDYIELEIRCQVNANATNNLILTNIAEITQIQDEKGDVISPDRDSTPNNVTLPEDENLPEYKGNEDNKSDLVDSEYYYVGQEDDDDFDKIIVQKFDLALKKFIIKVNDEELQDEEEYTREPDVDARKLGSIDENTKKEITNATYTMTKEPVKVKKGDIVTYNIRVYNEGTLGGYANEITENIPEGLEFIGYEDNDGSINDTYNWIMLDENGEETTNVQEASKLISNYLSSNEYYIPEANVSEEGAAISYQDIQVQFKVTLDPKQNEDNIIKNVAQISAESNNDIDSNPSREEEYNYDGINEDDIDYEPVQVTYLNLALRKFVTKVDAIDYNNRYPEVVYGEDGSIDYKHTKDPVDLETGATVVYTMRIYNEGNMAGYAEEVTDNLPEGLEFLPDHEINEEYKWKMINKEGEEVTDINAAEKVTTNYLSSMDPSNVIDAMAVVNGQKMLSYKDIKIAFKVSEMKNTDKLLINIATITETSDEDIDETDNTDKEYVEIRNFDLSLKKWVIKTIVTYNGKTTTKETGFNENSTEFAKVDIVPKQAKKTIVKFVYKIKVTNEGKVAGYVSEIKDYVPSGLEFVESDNEDWVKDKDGNITTSQLTEKLLQPGESATVEVTLRWKQSTSNMGIKTNYAEISKDSGDDIDSIPDNYDLKEDDIDDASVVISIKTGMAKTYILLITIAIAILGSGTYLIKKYVME